jgi:hypothetical protein
MKHFLTLVNSKKYPDNVGMKISQTEVKICQAPVFPDEFSSSMPNDRYAQ